MVAPKADGWFRMNPRIDVHFLPDFNCNAMYATGIGILMQKRWDYFLANIDSIILHPIEMKNGCIDYISGLMARVEDTKVQMVDFSSMLDYLGRIYDFIIVDFGRLGSSDINDQIIKLFASVAFKNIVVTTNDIFEIQSFRHKLAMNKIDMKKIAWLVNMCSSTKIDDRAKRNIDPAKYAMMPFNPNMYGKKVNFMSESMARDKIIRFMDEQLLNTRHWS